MSTITDRNDRDTLEYIGRNPGAKRSSAWVYKASVMRLIQEGLVAQPNSSGKLFLTDDGRAVAEHLTAITADAGHAAWCAGPSAHLTAPAETGDH